MKNAMEAMPRGRISVYAQAKDGSVIVRVLDEGEGLSPQLRDSPFEAFVSTKQSGLGLGLSICQEVATEHKAIALMAAARSQRSCFPRSTA
jgi:C4-dicarboxylate-specific signal transduction histidine kinase